MPPRHLATTSGAKHDNNVLFAESIDDNLSDLPVLVIDGATAMSSKTLIKTGICNIHL